MNQIDSQTTWPLRLEIHSSNYVFIAMQLFGKKYVVGHREGLLVMRSNWASCAQRRQIQQQREKGLCIDCNGHKQFLRTGDSQSVSQNRRHFDTLGPSCNKPSSARRVYGLIATQTQAVLGHRARHLAPPATNPAAREGSMD